MKCDYPKEVIQFQKSMDTGINVGSKNGSNLGKNIEINIDLKIGIESQSYDRAHIHVQVQFH